MHCPYSKKQRNEWLGIVEQLELANILLEKINQLTEFPLIYFLTYINHGVLYVLTHMSLCVLSIHLCDEYVCACSRPVTV